MPVAGPDGHTVAVRGSDFPASVLAVITSEVARELASAYDDQVAFPDRVVVDQPGPSDRLFPGWPAPVLLIAVENQGVCAWGVPLDDPDPPVLVGGDLAGGAEGTTVRYASSVAGFVAARRWDQSCLSATPLVQAQAAELDPESLQALRTRFLERPSTWGWPGVVQYRFERHGTRILLWSGPEQCDWWISSRSHDQLRDAVTELMDLSDLRASLWSNDPTGDAMLTELRSQAAR